MMFFKKLFPKITNEKNIILGRWKINYCKNYLDRKVYLANYDHCGPCGSIEKLPKSNSKNKID